VVLKGLVYRGAGKLKGLVDIRPALPVALRPLFSSSLALDFSQYRVVAFPVDVPCLCDKSLRMQRVDIRTLPLYF
jgi:hypothetical protein